MQSNLFNDTYLVNNLEPIQANTPKYIETKSIRNKSLLVENAIPLNIQSARDRRSTRSKSVLFQASDFDFQNIRRKSALEKNQNANLPKVYSKIIKENRIKRKKSLTEASESGKSIKTKFSKISEISSEDSDSIMNNLSSANSSYSDLNSKKSNINRDEQGRNEH